jgi:hypothetical protein
VFFLKQKSSVVGCSWLEGTGFWHELYSARGGFEAIYADVQRPIGFLRFAKTVPAKGSGRLGHPDIRTNVHAD